MKYDIVSSGSHGNAVVIEDSILIDCGVSYKSLKMFVPKLKLVLLTHVHADHFRKNTIRRLAHERPTLRWGCCSWLAEELLALGVSRFKIDVYETGKLFCYSNAKVECFGLKHSAANCGYKLYIGGKKLLYATDTNEINTQARNFDLYLIEANYEAHEIQKRIEQKTIAGEDFIYEYNVLKDHLSLDAAMGFLAENAGAKSEYVLMHQHKKTLEDDK